MDMNPICVARSIIIHKMLQLNINKDTIFNVWYSSCLTKKDVDKLKMVLAVLLKENHEK